MLGKLLPGLFLTLLLAACSPQSKGPERPWRSFVTDLTNTLRLVERETGGTTLLSTADPTGGNDDFNRFAGPGSESGWVTLANLKGPGVVRRFWTTGVDPGHPFRFYFDGEKKPRVEGTIDELFGERDPFTPPLARYMNLCWFSYVPLTYQRSLRIEAKAPPTHPFWGPRRFFFQINDEKLPATANIQSFPAALSSEDEAVLALVGDTWTAAVEWPEMPASPTHATEIAPNTEAVVWQSTGPGILPEWFLDVKPADPAAWSRLEKEWMLQDVVLRIRYDGREQPSVEVPLGDFFGNAWRHRDYASLLLGAGPTAFRSGFPLAFPDSVSISLLNGSDRAINAIFAGAPQPLTIPHPRYFHAEWRRSGPDAGAPHVMASFQGSGLFAGAFLGLTGKGVTQQDNSWWLLEGDEQMWVDGERQSSWRGTGLEDYFNGGWYYRSAAFSALHGIFDRVPFRTAQYRLQLVDPVSFSQSLQMAIERGDRNVSHAWFQSVAFAYLDSPTAVHPVPARREERRAVENRYDWQDLMLQLTELERMNNFQRAIDLIEEYGERAPTAPDLGIYKLRALEYRRLLGEPIGNADMKPFLDGQFGPDAAEQARLLDWFYAAPNRALVGLNANAQAQLFLNGALVAATDHPLAWKVVGAELGDGPLALASDATMIRQEPWVQIGLRTHSGFAGSGLDTERARRTSGAWNALEGDKTDWTPVPNPDLLRGTPDAPFIGSAPNAFVLFGSKSYSVRSEDWAYHQGRGYFRMDLTLPLSGWPTQSREITGLAR
ncbi:MAG: DUF2961 domain-containing protein [Verrucomicrobia bacterium]|nr:DUF2961 domain-containing protein [Verrucomicrobiota bacterium]